MGKMGKKGAAMSGKPGGWIVVAFWKSGGFSVNRAQTKGSLTRALRSAERYRQTVFYMSTDDFRKNALPIRETDIKAVKQQEPARLTKHILQVSKLASRRLQ